MIENYETVEGARRDNLQVFVDVPALQLYCMQLSSVCITSSWKKLRCWDQDLKIIKMVKMTSQSWSWANAAWGSCWSNTFIIFQVDVLWRIIHILYRGMLLLATSLTIQSLYNGAWSNKLVNLKKLKNWVRFSATHQDYGKPTKSLFGALNISLLRMVACKFTQ